MRRLPGRGIGLGQPDCRHRPQHLAINHSVSQVARHFIHGNQMKEGMLNRVSAVVRAYDPCLSCSTHADGTLALEIALKGPGGEVLDSLG